MCLPSSFLSWYALVANPQATSAGSIAHSAVSAQDAARVDGGMISLYNLPAAPGSNSHPVKDMELGEVDSDPGVVLDNRSDGYLDQSYHETVRGV